MREQGLLYVSDIFSHTQL